VFEEGAKHLVAEPVRFEGESPCVRGRDVGPEHVVSCAQRLACEERRSPLVTSKCSDTYHGREEEWKPSYWVGQEPGQPAQVGEIIGRDNQARCNDEGDPPLTKSQLPHGAKANLWGIEPTAENTSLVISDRIPAAAALYFGLGAKRAARMPGHFGALFAAPSDVGQLLSALESVLEGPSPEMLARTRRWLNRGNNQSISPEELFAFLPSALRIAQAGMKGCWC